MMDALITRTVTTAVVMRMKGRRTTDIQRSIAHEYDGQASADVESCHFALIAEARGEEVSRYVAGMLSMPRIFLLLLWHEQSVQPSLHKTEPFTRRRRIDRLRSNEQAENVRLGEDLILLCFTNTISRRSFLRAFIKSHCAICSFVSFPTIVASLHHTVRSIKMPYTPPRSSQPPKGLPFELSLSTHPGARTIGLR